MVSVNRDIGGMGRGLEGKLGSGKKEWGGGGGGNLYLICKVSRNFFNKKKKIILNYIASSKPA